MSESGIRRRYEAFQERIAEACERTGRSADSVRLMAVSKQQPDAKITEALEAGIRWFGENRVQELVRRWPERLNVDDDCLESGVLRKDVHVSLIGHLQRNKAAQVSAFVDSIESIDNPRTVDALVSRLSTHTPLDVLVQINTSGEASKFGLPEDEKQIFELVDMLCRVDTLRPRGVMTVAPFVDDEKAIRRCFKSLHAWYEKIGREYTIDRWDTVSMGMSGDFEIAVEEGSTEVRIGTGIFGERSS
ncbi:MAG: YggS family pyridoxal phosphate-dependent enzyme [Spirochaetaceae bacterium]|nr:MAG: YggS family pyridoxal phosphate-dependent enzyme [Spirochaetaceae bacterium]